MLLRFQAIQVNHFTARFLICRTHFVIIVADLMSFQPNGGRTWPRCRCVPPDFLFRPLSTAPDDHDDSDDDNDTCSAATSAGLKANRSDRLQTPTTYLNRRLVDEYQTLWSTSSP